MGGLWKDRTPSSFVLRAPHPSARTLLPASVSAGGTGGIDPAPILWSPFRGGQSFALRAGHQGAPDARAVSKWPGSRRPSTLRRTPSPAR